MITDFLLARIAEDLEAIGPPFGRDETPHGAPNGIGWADVGGLDDVLMSSQTRALAECEANRTIVTLHLPTSQHTFCITCTDIDVEPPNNIETYPCRTLRALATIYADHPDYQKDWAL